MNTNLLRGQQGIAFSVIFLGLYVGLGWLFHIESMVRVVPASVAMGVNTAVLFILAGITLWPQPLHRQRLRGQTIAAWILLLLPCLILIEHARNVDLGIDWVSLHSTVKDGNPNPGRTAPNTCFGFLFAGMAVLLYRPTRKNRLLRWVAAFSIYATLAIGLTALIGFILKLDSIYSFASYNRMAIPSAVGMSIIGLGLWLRRYLDLRRNNVDWHSPDQRITKTAAIILTVLTLTTGLAAFTILRQGFEESMSDAFLHTTQNNVAAFSATLNQGLILATTIASRPALQNHLSILNQDPQNVQALKLTEEVGKSFFSSGMTTLQFFNVRGEKLLAIGNRVSEKAEMAIPLHSIEHQAVLLWQDGFVLHTEKQVMQNGRVVGKFIVEQRLPILTTMLRDQQQGNFSTDILICGRIQDEAVCFPSRFYAHLRIPMYKDGKPYLAISRALLNQRGVMSVKDARGIPVLAGYAPIGNLGLGLVLKTDLVEMYSPIRHRLNLVALLLVALVGAGTLILRAQVSPLARQLVKDRQRMEVILESSHEAFIGMDQNGAITDWNVQAERTFGWSRSEVIGKALAEVIIPPGMRDAHHQGFARFLKTGKGPVIGKRIELPAIHRNGEKFLVEITISAIKNDNGYSFTAFLHDISVRKNAEAELFSEKERLRVTLNSIGDAVITTDIAGHITYLNPVAEVMTGWTTLEAKGLPLPRVFHILDENTGEIAPNPVDSVLLNQTVACLAEYTILLQRDGTRIPIEDSAAPIKDKDNNLIGVVLVFHDVSLARTMAAEMTHQATHDALTGLINRREFERRVELALQTGKQQQQQHTMLYLDLDQFKIVNDTCGHIAGDELLRQLTTVLEEKLRKSDTLARLGGDEFGVLLESCAAEPAHKIAEVLRKTVSDFHFVWLDKVFPIGVSIGLVTFSDGGVTLADVLRMADAACYVAKGHGRNRIHAYTAEDKELALRHGEIGWIERIQKALDEHRFVLYTQQILALGDEATHGEHYELLLRMRDEDGQIIPPMAFIPAAERYGLMPLLDRWVIETAFAQHGARHPAGSAQGMCAINLSATSICDDYFLAFVEAQFKQYNVTPSSICFEITETTAIANLNKATAMMRALRKIGCRFALDDFGSGMASFAYLKHLPVDYLKIDGGFVKDMLEDPIGHAMVQSINHIGHVMGLKTIAEFVESEEILEELRVIGVDFAQGYAIEKPRPL